MADLYVTRQRSRPILYTQNESKRETCKSYKLKPGLFLLKNILFHRLIIKPKFKKELK